MITLSKGEIFLFPKLWIPPEGLIGTVHFISFVEFHKKPKDFKFKARLFNHKYECPLCDAEDVAKKGKKSEVS